MLKPEANNSKPLDLKVVGTRWKVDCARGDYGRVTARLDSGEWTDAVLTVYGSIDGGKTIHETGETLTASSRATGVIDVIGWTDLIVEVTTADTGSGGTAIADSMFKGPA